MICKRVCRTRKSNKQELKIYEIHYLKTKSRLPRRYKSPEAEDRKRSVFFLLSLFFYTEVVW
ncbi:unnamed protein product [Brassica rapa subsp. narinosa]